MEPRIETVVDFPLEPVIPQTVDGHRSTKELSELLHDAYQLTKKKDLKNDVREILDSFAKLDLLEPCSL